VVELYVVSLTLFPELEMALHYVGFNFARFAADMATKLLFSTAVSPPV
jgi:hypothetical protein